MAYTTTALCKTYMGITATADDTLIGTIVTRAQSIVDNYVGRTFEAGSDSTKRFDAVRNVFGRFLVFDGGLELAQAPTTITNGDATVLIINTDVVLNPWNSFPVYALELMPSSSNVWQYDTAGNPQRAISIVGRWAYSLTAPDDVVAATVRLVSFLYRQRENSADYDRPVSVSDGMVLMPGRLPADIASILQPYRRFTA